MKKASKGKGRKELGRKSAPGQSFHDYNPMGVSPLSNQFDTTEKDLIPSHKKMAGMGS